MHWILGGRERKRSPRDDSRMFWGRWAEGGGVILVELEGGREGVWGTDEWVLRLER